MKIQARSKSLDRRCPYCRDEFHERREVLHLCPSCQTLYHNDCTDHCVLLGCDKQSLKRVRFYRPKGTKQVQKLLLGFSFLVYFFMLAGALSFPKNRALVLENGATAFAVLVVSLISLLVCFWPSRDETPEFMPAPGAKNTAEHPTKEALAQDQQDSGEPIRTNLFGVEKRNIAPQSNNKRQAQQRQLDQIRSRQREGGLGRTI